MAPDNQIEIHHDPNCTRILLPPSAPPRLLSDPARMKETLPMWIRFTVFVAFLGWAAWFMVKYPGQLPPKDRSKGLLLGLAMFGGACVVAHFALRHFMAAGRAGTRIMPKRVELVIDKRAITQSGNGLFFLWRVPLKEVRALIVCPPSPRWPSRSERSPFATVRIVGKNGAAARAWIWGAYEPAIAVEAAVALMQEIERIRVAEGIRGHPILMRDELSILPREGLPERTLESVVVRFERNPDGVRLELARWLTERPPREDEGYLISMSMMSFLYGFLLLTLGAIAGATIGEAIGHKQGVLNAVGLTVAISSIVGGFAWMFSTFYRRVTYYLRSDGLQQRSRIYGLSWKRHWPREEIAAVFLRVQPASEGRIFETGIQARSGKRVILAIGWRWTAEAFADLLQQEMGLPREH